MSSPDCNFWVSCLFLPMGILPRYFPLEHSATTSPLVRGHVCCSHVKGSLKNTLCDLDIDLICHGALGLAPALPFCSPVLKSQLDIFSFTCNILSDLGNSLIYLGRFKIEKTSNRDRPAAFCYWSAPWVKAHYEQKGRVRYKFLQSRRQWNEQTLDQKKKKALCIAGSMEKYSQGEEEKGKVRQKEQTALHAQWTCTSLTPN